MSIKKNIVFSALCIGIALFSFTGCVSSKTAIPRQKRLIVSYKTVATVNGRKISQAELDLAIQQVQEERISVITHRSVGLTHDGTPGTPEEIALDRLVNEKLLLLEAESRKLTVSKEEIKSYLKGMETRYIPNLSTVFRNAKESDEFISILHTKVHDELLKKKLKQAIFSEILVSKEEVQTFYNENRDIYIKDATFRIQHLFIKAPKKVSQELKDKAARKASILRSMILRGTDFGDLARKHSDDIHTTDKGGDMGYFRKGIPMPGIHNEAFKLREGQVSSVIVKNQGYHLLRVSELKDIEMRPMYAVYDEIVYRIRVQKNIRAAQHLIHTLREAAVVKIK